MGPRFEFIPCTCPEAEIKKHGHIYDHDKKTNSLHIYDKSGGVHFIKSLPSGEITEENAGILLTAMNGFFKKMKKDWFFIMRYPLIRKVGEYNELQCHMYSTSKELSVKLKEWAKNTFYTGIVIIQLKDTGKMVKRKALAKKYFKMKV